MIFEYKLFYEEDVKKMGVFSKARWMLFAAVIVVCLSLVPSFGYADVNSQNASNEDAYTDDNSVSFASENTTDFTNVEDKDALDDQAGSQISSSFSGSNSDFSDRENVGLIWDSNGLRYLNEDGTYFNGGWKTVSGSTYYFKEDGYAAQWGLTLDGKQYYFNEDCTMVTGIVTWAKDGTKSFFGPDGVMTSGWQTWRGKTYYIDPSTMRAVKWGLTLDGKQYYFNEDCTMVTGIVTWAKDGTKSFFGPDGVMTSGWQTWRGKTYYIDPSTMRAVKWGHTIDGQFYYFDEDCSMYNRGWLRWNSDGTYSYFPSNGIRYTGSHWIDGIYYDFGSNGICYTYDYEKASMARMAQEYVSNTGYLIFVNRYTHKVGVFSGGYNNWTLLYYWSCVTGAPNSPTITGSYYTTGFKRPSLSTDSRAIYCTQIWGGYFFHSILSSESELGQSLSHGCIRLPYSAANWIYNNVYAGTRVYIYN